MESVSLIASGAFLVILRQDELFNMSKLYWTQKDSRWIGFIPVGSFHGFQTDNRIFHSLSSSHLYCPVQLPRDTVYLDLELFTYLLLYPSLICLFMSPERRFKNWTTEINFLNFSLLPILKFSCVFWFTYLFASYL